MTSAQRRRQMGHKDDNTFQAYIGRTSGVDVQGIINDEAPDQAFIDFVASMETMVDQGAPVPHGSLLVHPRKRNSRSPNAVMVSHLPTDDPYNPFDGTETTAPFTSAIKRGPPSRYLLAYLRHDTSRASFTAKADASSENTDHALHEIVAPLCAMAMPDKGGWSYPGAQPSPAGTCSYCGHDVSNR